MLVSGWILEVLLRNCKDGMQFFEITEDGLHENKDLNLVDKVVTPVRDLNNHCFVSLICMNQK
jgi:hypothetical protein